MAPKTDALADLVANLFAALHALDPIPDYMTTIKIEMMGMQTIAVIAQIGIATALLNAIAGYLDQQEWTPDTVDAIARLLREAGYEIREPK